MKVAILKAITNKLPFVKRFVRKKGDTLFFIEGCSDVFSMGFKLSESRFSISLSFWVTPLVHFQNYKVCVFEKFNLIQGNKVREVNYIKDSFSDEELLKDVCGVMSDNIGLSSEICSPESFIVYALDNSDEWLVSGYSKAQLSLLCFSVGMYGKSKALISAALPDINENHPGYSELKEFSNFILSDDIDSAVLLKDRIVARNLSGESGCWIGAASE